MTMGWIQEVAAQSFNKLLNNNIRAVYILG